MGSLLVKIGDADLYGGDCLEVMPMLGVVDMVLADPPYGTTACKWDSVIPLESMWGCIRGVVKGNGAVVLTASQPFTSSLVLSNPEWFKYTWVWIKNIATGYMNAKARPLKATEDVLVFSGVRADGASNLMTYNPVGVISANIELNNSAHKIAGDGACLRSPLGKKYKQTTTNYPRNVLPIPSDRGLHPTQKPVALMEYLIKTYTNEGETVLDFTMGSGTTGVACANTGRKFIGIEKDPKYFQIAVDRIREAYEMPKQVSI